MTSRVWLIGGTQESRQVVEHLYRRRIAPEFFVITVTTQSARQLYPSDWQGQVWVGQLQSATADEFVTTFEIGSILDLSHPFATQISQLAIAVAAHYSLPYLRYERATVESPPQTWRDRRDRPGYISIPSLSWAFDQGLFSQERTLLILGYRLLPQFAPHQSSGVLFARILPSAIALDTAISAGFTSDRLMALRPPISAELERALWQHWQISQVVIKASGRAGGEAQKQAIATELGVRLVCLARPELTYPQQTDQLDTAIAFAVRYGTHQCEDSA